MLLRLTFASRSYPFLTVYRPPCSSKPHFLSDFSLLLEDIATSPADFFILGDFNLHMDNLADHYSTAFNSLLETFDLKQHVSQPTHSSGHILDLLITKSTSTVSDCAIMNPFVSDHSAILCKLPVTVSTRPSRILKTIRKLSSINITNFSSDILSSSLYTDPSSTLSNYVVQFRDVLTSILDKHAPQKTITCRSTPNKPYYTADISKQKRNAQNLNPFSDVISSQKRMKIFMRSSAN